MEHKTNKIRLLVWMHLGVSLALALIACSGIDDMTRELSAILRYATYVVATCQLCLLAIWLTFGTSKLWKRICGSMAGVAFFIVLTCFRDVVAINVGRRFETWDIVASLLPTVSVWRFANFVALSIALLVLRRFRFRMSSTLSPELAIPSDRIQFSIRQLMILTFVVAVVVSIGKYARVVLGQELQAIFQDTLLRLLYTWSQLAIGVVYSISLTLLALWAVLTRHRPFARMVLAVILAAGIGLIGPFFFGRQWSYFLIGSALAALQVLLLMVSLLVVRSAGYRFVRHRSEITTRVELI